jgi:hypothetical protein
MMSDDVMKRAMAWLCGDTGSSSKAILTHMMGNVSSGEYPLDAGDLGRCLRLLRIIPEWKPRIGEMATYGGAWIEIAERWAELEQSMLEEVGLDWEKGRRATKTHELLRAMELSGMKRDPSYTLNYSKDGRLIGWTSGKRRTIKLGDGASVELPA